jgi:hypothetical protein
LLLFGSFHFWWAGHCYGPRYITDVLPAIAVLAAPALRDAARPRWSRACLVAFLAWGVFLQAVGVYFDDGAWNRWPDNIDEHPERVWSLRDAHPYRALLSGFKGAEFAPALAQAVRDPRPALFRPLPDADLDGRVAVHAAPTRVRAGSTAEIDVEVSNDGSRPWPAFVDFGPNEVCVLYVWLRNGRAVTDAGDCSRPPRNIMPDESVRWPMRIEIPQLSGRYELALRIVQSTFGGGGKTYAPALEMTVEVE